LHWSFHYSITPPLHHSSRLPQVGKSMGAPSGGSAKPGPLGPDSLFHGIRPPIIDESPGILKLSFWSTGGWILDTRLLVNLWRAGINPAPTQFPNSKFEIRNSKFSLGTKNPLPW
jgi:hypothetical protein